MKQELDKLLCEKYPKMMVNRNKSWLRINGDPKFTDVTAEYV